MAKDIREQLQEILSSNTFVARLIDGSDVKGLPGNKIDILMDDELTMSSYIQVPVLPLVKDAKEGVFYILPNSSINYIIDGQWESVFPTDEVIKKVKKADGTVLPVNTADMSVTLPQDDLSDGFYFTTATLKIEPGDTQQVAISDIADFNKNNLVIGETTLFDQDGTMAVVISLVNTSTVQTKTMTAVGTGAAAKTFTATSTLLNTEIGGATNVAVSDLDNYDSAVCKVGTSFITDKMGRLGIVTSKSATTVAVRTINNITHSGHVMYTTDILDNKRNAITPLTFSTFDYQYEDAGLVPFIVNKTIVYDQHGTLAKVASVDEANEQVEVQTFMSIDWAGEAFHHSQLTGEVGEVVEVLVSDLDAYDDDLCIPYRSFIYDNHGRIGIVTAKTVSKLTLSILVSPSSYTEYKTYLQYDPGTVGDELSQTPLQTTMINTDYILGWDTTLNGRDGKWCVYDENGTLALITNSTPVLGEVEATTLVSSETKHDRFYWINGNNLNGVAVGSQATVDWNTVRDKDGTSWDPAIHPDKYEIGKTMASDMLGTIGVLTQINTVGGPSKLTFKRVSVEVPALFVIAQSKFNDYGTTSFSAPFGNPSYGKMWTNQTLIMDPSRTAVGTIVGDRQGQFLFKVFKFYRLANGYYLNPTPLGTCVHPASRIQTYNGNGWGSLSYNTFYKGNGLVFDNNGNIGYISDNSDTSALEVTTISSQYTQKIKFCKLHTVDEGETPYYSGNRFFVPQVGGQRSWNTFNKMSDLRELPADSTAITDDDLKAAPANSIIAIDEQGTIAIWQGYVSSAYTWQTISAGDEANTFYVNHRFSTQVTKPFDGLNSGEKGAAPLRSGDVVYVWNDSCNAGDWDKMRLNDLVIDNTGTMAKLASATTIDQQNGHYYRSAYVIQPSYGGAYRLASDTGLTNAIGGITTIPYNKLQYEQQVDTTLQAFSVLRTDVQLGKLVVDSKGTIGKIFDVANIYDSGEIKIKTITSINTFSNVYHVGYKMSYQSGQKFDLDDANMDAGETPVANNQRAWLWTNTDKFSGDENNVKAGDIVIDSTGSLFRVVAKNLGTAHLFECARIGTAMVSRLQLDSSYGTLPAMGNTGTFYPNAFKVYRDWDGGLSSLVCGPEDIAVGQLVSDAAGRYAIVTETNEAYISNEVKVRTIIDPYTLVSFSPRMLEANIGEVDLGNGVYGMRFKGSGVSSGSTDDMVELFGINTNIYSMGATPVIINWGGTVYRNMGSTVRPLKLDLVSNYEEIGSGSLYDTVPEGTAGLYTTEQQDPDTGDPFQAPALIWHQPANPSLPSGTTIGYDIWITYYKTIV